MKLTREEELNLVRVKEKATSLAQQYYNTKEFANKKQAQIAKGHLTMGWQSLHLKRIS